MSPDPISIDPGQWVDRYGDYLYRYALSRLGDAEAAEEVVQETLMAGLRSVGQYAGKGTERAWLLGILKRKIVDLLRRRSRTESLDAAEGDDPAEVLFDRRGRWQVDRRTFGPMPSDPMEQAEFWQVFRRCLEGLPRRQADVFSLRELDGKNSREICKDLDISASNLWVLLYRARLRLADCMRSRWQADRGTVE